MEKNIVLKGNICQTKTAKELDLHENAFVVCVDGVSKGVLPHPQSLNLAERMERAVYLGLDAKKLTAKFVAGRKIL